MRLIHFPVNVIRFRLMRGHSVNADIGVKNFWGQLAIEMLNRPCAEHVTACTPCGNVPVQCDRGSVARCRCRSLKLIAGIASHGDQSLDKAEMVCADMVCAFFQIGFD